MTSDRLRAPIDVSSSVPLVRSMPRIGRALSTSRLACCRSRRTTLMPRRSSPWAKPDTVLPPALRRSPRWQTLAVSGVPPSSSPPTSTVDEAATRAARVATPSVASLLGCACSRRRSCDRCPHHRRAARRLRLPIPARFRCDIPRPVEQRMARLRAGRSRRYHVPWRRSARVSLRPRRPRGRGCRCRCRHARSVLGGRLQASDHRPPLSQPRRRGT